jgi:hypothetical protein
MAMAMMIYSTHENWYEVVNGSQTRPGLKKQLGEERSRAAQLQAELTKTDETLKSERAARDKRIANLETEKENMHRLYLENEKEKEGLVQDNRRLTGDMEATLKNTTAQLQELTTLRDTIRQVQTQKEQAFTESVKLTDDLNNAEGELKLLKDRNVQLTAQMAKAYAMLEAHDLNPHSIGADDGLRRGHMLEVYRHGASDSKYLGRIEVVRTQPDKAVAKILPAFRKGAIQKEDRVATRLN